MFNTTDKPKTNRPCRMARDSQAKSVQTSGTITSEVASSETLPPKRTKSSLVIGLLSRREGATLDHLVEATGWLPHTTRAALTGLKKKGHTIERRKVGDQTIYFRV